MNAPNNDNNSRYRNVVPADFKHRLRMKWSDHKPAPAIEPGQVMVRLWNEQRFSYSVSDHEIPAFCAWLAWSHSGASPKTRTRVVRGIRCLYVVRLPSFLDDSCGKPEHAEPDELPKILKRLDANFGAPFVRRILADFF